MPSDLFSFTNLKGLYLHDNTILTTISPEIWNLTNLIYLWFRNNKITSVPSEIITLTKLTSLTLSHFDLTSIPPEVYNLNNFLADAILSFWLASFEMLCLYALTTSSIVFVISGTSRKCSSILFYEQALQCRKHIQ